MKLRAYFSHKAVVSREITRKISNREEEKQDFSCEFHTPPPPDSNNKSYYDDNTSIFGAILRGENPALVLQETESVLALQDKYPNAPLHALVIPKKCIKTIRDLKEEDLKLLEEMHDTALEVLRSKSPLAYKEKDYVLCYHLPPFNSVDHLHLHILAPVSKMNWIYRYGKYFTGTFWCASEYSVLEGLKKKE
mmetsp:Transcript_30589/g.34894  ORF Transcript_30589/g.34894 Transcript_30589/m.34894 type:complete len:192 (+) Transcript_30589:212-787(+)|eukprot:CAMPEP_0194151112 /NCGR_PEP_ID=MMETSP0152-20130528/46732_1 /TAXON_ID=1049557 /ORGANISM="Thalassiothrix antarctica, Strain L6-D1" /LENGTH=191 /DNA_ID=CAMNT_0038854659 /DNA_START=177 /DNA_END=752 /DNA_ORIENTATION=-